MDGAGGVGGAGGSGGVGGSGSGGSVGGGDGGNAGGPGGSVGGGEGASAGGAGGSVGDGDSAGGSASAGSGANAGAGSSSSGNADLGGAFGDAMSDAAENDNQSDDKSDTSASGQNASASGKTDGAGQAPGGLAARADDDDTADKAARDSQHANEFDGLGPSSAPMSGADSLNSHRGYGPDGSLAGGIDQDVNAGLDQDDEGKPAAPNTDAANVVGVAGYAGAGLQGGLEAMRDNVDRTARGAAAGTLTNGNAGNLPAKGFANRADLASTITDSRMTASKAMDVTPYSDAARSTQQLNAGATKAATIGRFANGAGLAIQPGAGAYQGFVNTPEDASWAERATNTVIGAVKEFDDTGLSYGAGLAVGTGTVAVSAFAGPAMPVVAGSAPATATAAAIGTGLAYDNSSIDQAIDGFIEDYGRPGLLSTLNAVDNYVVGPISGFMDRNFGDEASEGGSR